MGKPRIIPELRLLQVIRTDLWVETEFDTDGVAKWTGMHVNVTRSQQTDTEGLKLPRGLLPESLLCKALPENAALFGK